MAATDYEQLGLPELVRRLFDAVSTLVEKQIALAKQEAREDWQHAKRSALWLAVGAGLLLLAAICVPVVLITGTAALLRWPSWGAALLWLVLFAVLGLLCLFQGRRRFPTRPFERTRAALQENWEWVKQRLKPQAR
ncbi:MAG TPA: phage holin family protein [Chloroflexota bacterium]|nr:phage holin family protein [Chloroflexota bacterium]